MVYQFSIAPTELEVDFVTSKNRGFNLTMFLMMICSFEFLFFFLSWNTLKRSIKFSVNSIRFLSRKKVLSLFIFLFPYNKISSDIWKITHFCILLTAKDYISLFSRSIQDSNEHIELDSYLETCKN